MSPERLRLIVFTTLTLLSVTTEAYNILYVSTVQSPSHGRLGQGYVRELLKRGHQVTYVVPFPIKDAPANLTQIDINFIMSTVPPDMLTFETMKAQPDTDVLPEWISLLNEGTILALRHEILQKLIMDKSQSFDLVIVDWLFNEILAGFAALYQCPFVYSSSLEVHSGILALVDDIANPAYTDDVMVTYPKPYSFFQRVGMLRNLLRNIFITHSVKRQYAVVYEEVFSEAARQRGFSLPPYEDVIYNASLVLVNSHASFDSANKLPQNVKPVGGYYIDRTPSPLPHDLQKLMDEAKYGVVLFSFGTNAKSKDIPIEIRKKIINVFAGLKQIVLWKFEEDLPDLPKNIITRKWLPQSSILAHPNLKVFITHGGSLSTTEAVWYGVPIIGVPLFGDQFLNIKHAVRKGFAVKVQLSDNLAEDLKSALDTVLTNSSYEASAKRLSSLYHDRPLQPAEELVYWLEYAVRTGGAPHLRSAALLLPWYQRLYLDLLALIALTLVGLIMLAKGIIRRIYLKPRLQRKKNE